MTALATRTEIVPRSYTRRWAHPPSTLAVEITDDRSEIEEQNTAAALSATAQKFRAAAAKMSAAAELLAGSIQTLTVGSIDARMAQMDLNTATDSFTLLKLLGRIAPIEPTSMLALSGRYEDFIAAAMPSFGLAAMTTNYDLLLAPHHRRGPMEFIEFKAPTFPQDDWDRAIQDLHDAVSEWDVPDALAPAEITIRAIERLIPAIRVLARLPDFDLNDDGSVALRWRHAGDARSFALHVGRRRLNAVLSEPKVGPGFAQAWQLDEQPNQIESGIVRLLLRKDVTPLVK